jgi:hypothetical protein
MTAPAARPAKAKYGPAISVFFEPDIFLRRVYTVENLHPTQMPKKAASKPKTGGKKKAAAPRRATVVVMAPHRGQKGKGVLGTTIGTIAHLLPF